MKEFSLSIITPEKVAFEGKAQYLNLPAWEGLMGVLPGHAPALVLLHAGAVTIRDDSGERHLAVSGGFAEIGPKKVVLFAETAEQAEEISKERARLDAEQAKALLARARGKGVDYAEADILLAEAKLRKALVRLQVADRMRHIPKGPRP